MLQRTGHQMGGLPVAHNSHGEALWQGDKKKPTMLLSALFCAVICAEKLGFGEGAPARDTDYFRQKHGYSMQFYIAGIL